MRPLQGAGQGLGGHSRGDDGWQNAPGARWWIDQAACRGLGPQEFFGPSAGGVRWCRRCPVIDCCFWTAMVAEFEDGLRFGIWGGATPATRERVAAVVGSVWARTRLDQALGHWAAANDVSGEPYRRAG
jgi:hypothetical protein